MTRLFFALLCVLCANVAHASGYTFSNGYWWKGGQAYTRSEAYKCCSSKTGWCYQYTPHYFPQKASSNVTTTNYTYNINYSQPAADQGNTQFGYAPQLSLQSYGALDLGATIDGLLRLSGDMQAGASGVAGDVKDLTSEAAAFVTANNQATAAVAEIYAKTELLKAAQPSPQLNLKLGAAVGGEQNQVFAAGAPGPLVTQHCANCHTGDKDGAKSFSLGSLIDPHGRGSAAEQIALGKMPKGVELDAATRLALIAEIHGK